MEVINHHTRVCICSSNRLVQGSELLHFQNFVLHTSTLYQFCRGMELSKMSTRVIWNMLSIIGLCCCVYRPQADTSTSATSYSVNAKQCPLPACSSPPRRAAPKPWRGPPARHFKGVAHRPHKPALRPLFPLKAYALRRWRQESPIQLQHDVHFLHTGNAPSSLFLTCQFAQQRHMRFSRSFRAPSLQQVCLFYFKTSENLVALVVIIVIIVVIVIIVIY